MSMASVRRYYGIPIKRGMLVREHDGRVGRVLSAPWYVYLRCEKTGKRLGPYHAAWRMTYLDNEGNVLWTDEKRGGQ